MPNSSYINKLRKSHSSVSRRKSILRKNGSRKNNKKVRINSPKNQIKVYSLGSEEIKWKQKSPLKKEDYCENGNFPCLYKGVVFENIDEWNDYIKNRYTRNESTGYKSIDSHKRSIISSLSKKGKLAKKIPEEWRLYNNQTGEVYDIRDLNPDSLSYKPLK
jgi:hypothetical protein